MRGLFIVCQERSSLGVLVHIRVVMGERGNRQNHQTHSNNYWMGLGRDERNSKLIYRY